MKKWLLVLYTAYVTILFISFIPFAVLLYAATFSITWGKGISFLYRFNKFWADAWIFLSGNKMYIKGKEHIQKGQAYVVVANHNSSADMFPAAAATPRPFRVLGKKELDNIPVMRFLFKKLVVYVDRSDTESRRKSIYEMKQILQQGISILIFPEGTRNKTDQPLKSFYDGAFRLAIEMQIPILPMVICNAKSMWHYDKFLICPQNLEVYFLPPVSTSGMTDENRDALKENIYKQMEQQVIRHDVLFKEKFNHSHF